MNKAKSYRQRLRDRREEVRNAAYKGDLRINSNPEGCNQYKGCEEGEISEHDIDYTKKASDSKYWGSVIASIVPDPRNTGINAIGSKKFKLLSKVQSHLEKNNTQDEDTDSDFDYAMSHAKEIARKRGDIKEGSSGTSKSTRRADKKFGDVYETR